MKIRRFVAFFIDLISILFPGAIISFFMNEHPLGIIIMFIFFCLYYFPDEIYSPHYTRFAQTLDKTRQINPIK